MSQFKNAIKVNSMMAFLNQLFRILSIRSEGF